MRHKLSTSDNKVIYAAINRTLSNFDIYSDSTEDSFSAPRVLRCDDPWAEITWFLPMFTTIMFHFADFCYVKMRKFGKCSIWKHDGKLHSTLPPLKRFCWYQMLMEAMLKVMKQDFTAQETVIRGLKLLQHPTRAATLPFV